MIDLDRLIESDGLYRTSFNDGRSFVWRLLTLKEFTVFRGLKAGEVLTEFELHLQVFYRCYIGESKFLPKDVPLGMLVSVGRLIMWLSGECELDTLKEDITFARQLYPVGSVNERMKQVIYTAFPAYLPEHVESWTRPNLLRRFALAEQVLIARGLDYKPLDVNGIHHPDDVAPVEEARPLQPHEMDVSKLDFEAAAMQQAAGQGGGWGVQDHLDRLAELEAEAKKKTTLTTEEAEALAKMKRTRR